MKLIISAFLVFISFYGESALAKCDTGSFINPITDIQWSCIFPIRIGGVELASGNEENSSTISNPVCICDQAALPIIGMRVSFWEPSRIIETVSDAYCMQTMGMSLQSESDGKLNGGLVNDANGNGKAFQQLHYYMFPAWSVLDMFMDLPCLDSNDFDLAMMTELNPAWNNEMLSLIVNPESILFANPVATLSCSADSIAATVGMPLNALFWCMGAWGNSYPLAGSITSTDYVEANAGLASRGIYLMGRTGLLMDTSNDGCTKSYSPIWKKDRYKLQLMKPTKGSACLPVGRDGMLWTNGKHSGKSDNFSWMMFKKNDCCLTY
jgi:conjugal transfer pilus assembly protein TraU